MSVRFGVNYTPAKGWFHHWLDVDLGEVRADLDAIRALGADHVRIFPLWPLLQPHRGLIRPRAIDDVCAVADTAAQAGLDVTIDVLQGHLSSFEFYPSWTRTWHQRNIFTDQDAVAAQAALIRAVAGAVAGRPHVLSISLGNEPNNLLANDPASVDQVNAWADTLIAAAGDAKPVIHNAFDAVWYDAGHSFTPRAMTTKGAMTVVHPWAFSGNCAQRYGSLAPQTTHLAEYVTELAKGHAVTAGRPVWVQEIGAPAPHVPAADAPEFARRSLTNLMTCADLWGVTWWCSHDVNRSLADFPELEYTLGLLTNDGQPKPLAEVYSAFARAAAPAPPAAPSAPRDDHGEWVVDQKRVWSTTHSPASGGGQPGGDRPGEGRPGGGGPALGGGPPGGEGRQTALVLDDDPGNRAAAAPGGVFFETWMDAAASGERLAITTISQAAAPGLLAARGITQLRDLS